MAETTSAPSLRDAPDQFIVLCGQIVGNRADGFQTVYGWDGEIHEDRKVAIAAGWKERESDDFNIGVIRDGRLASLDWMDESLDETAETLIEIEEQIDWRDPRDTFEVGQEADSLQQDGGESDFAWLARLRAHFIDPTTQAEAVAAARAEGPSWLPPDGGPKDRTPVILAVQARADGRIVVGEGYFDPEDDDGKWWWAGESRGDYSADAIETYFGVVIGWMPLPAPPTTPGGRTDG